MADQPSFPNSLRYTREHRNLSLEQVASELNTSSAKLAKIEAGEAVPTARQYELLSAIYGVPDFTLASEAKPDMPRLVVDLRQASPGPLSISPKGLKAYFARASTAEIINSIAQSLQISASLEKPRGVTIENVVQKAGEVSKLLDFDPREKRWIENPHLAFRFLRAKIEEFGIYCFLVEAPPTDYRGLFSSIDSRASLILINKKTFKDKARTFTLIHEFSHYLLGLEGASDPMRPNNRAEKACNEFASRFLAPEDVVQELFESSKRAGRAFDATVSYISKCTLLSFGAVAYRLKSDGLATDADYKKWYASNGLSPDYGAEDPVNDESDEGGGSGGGNWAYNVVTDIGFRPLKILAQALAQGALDDVHVGQILNARGDTQKLAFKTATDRLGELDL